MKKTYYTLTIFLVAIATLILIGLVFIYSSSSIYALEKCGSAHYYVTKQLIGIVIGSIALIIAILAPLSLIKKIAPFLFFSALLLTGMTLIPGIGSFINGSRRWLIIKGMCFQPSELLKIASILYLAFFLEKHQHHLRNFKSGYLPFLIIITLTTLVTLPQPDFGQAFTIALNGFIMFFIAQGSIYHLLYTVIPSIVGISLLIYLKPYRFKRILIFLNPWADPQGAGFQIIQSLIAIGSGGINGVGITGSKQKFFYLPMQHTDFIFSIIAEETGFIGVSILLTLFLTFLISGYKLGLSFKNNFSQLITLGFVNLINLQTIINLYVTTGLAPTKGCGLPFISYGSSAMVCNLFMIGIIINCVYEERYT